MKHSLQKPKNVIMFVLGFAFLAVALLVVARASTTDIAFEAESGALLGAATQLSDSTASAGKGLLFGQAASEPFECPAYQPLAPRGSGIARNVSNQSQLEAAMTAAVPGDVINLASGNYTTIRYRDNDSPSKKNGTPENPIVIQAASGATPIVSGGDVHGSGRAADISGVKHVYIRGLTARGGQFGIGAYRVDGVHIEYNNVSSTGDSGIHYRDKSYNGTIYCNTVTETGRSSGEHGEGIYIGTGSESPGYVDDTSNVLVKGNHIYDVTNEAVEIKQRTHSITVEDNHIHDLTPWYGGAITAGVGPLDWPNANYLIQRNRIYNVSKGRDYGTAISIAHGDSIIRNNIIWNIDTPNSWEWRHPIQVHADGSTYGFGNPSWVKIEIYNNTVWGCRWECINATHQGGAEPNVITRNNLLSNLDGGVVNASRDKLAASGDFVGPITGTADAGSGPGSGFRLKSSSSAVDSATAAPGFTDDVNGAVRPQGSGWDYGAYEQ